MAVEWTKSDIASLLSTTFANASSQSQSTSSSSGSTRNRKNKNTAPTASIDVLLTFDHGGISNHPNHRSLYHGARHFLASLMKDAYGYSCPVALYTLTTTSLLRKYIGVMDAPFTMVRGVMEGFFASRSARKEEGPARLLFVNSIGEWMTAQSAMAKAHQSQMVWFRWGWIGIGRYMVVNDLRREG